MPANITQFLEIFKTALSGDEGFRSDVCEIILEKTKFPLEKSCVSFKNNNLSIKTDPYMKTEISLCKEEILKAVKEKYPKKNIQNIF